MPSLISLKVRLHTAINRADFVSWCMLYTYDGNKITDQCNKIIELVDIEYVLGDVSGVQILTL